jgi:hypothetical protein
MQYTKAAVIIETRNLPNLTEIIFKHLEMLDFSWNLHIFCSDQNYELLKRTFPGADIINLHFSTLSTQQYNEILTSEWFWKRIIGMKVLIFQTDSMLLRKGIDEFLEWDYVGAPWKFQEHGGNGGLSLRTKQMMIRVIQSYPYSKSMHGNEDIYFSNHLLKIEGAKLAPREVCKKFSCETIPELNTLGYHAIEKYLDFEIVNQIKTQYVSHTKP